MYKTHFKVLIIGTTFEYNKYIVIPFIRFTDQVDQVEEPSYNIFFRNIQF